MKFKEFIKESFIKNEFSNMPEAWKKLYTSEKEMEFLQGISSIEDLTIIKKLYNDSDIVILMGSQPIVLIKDGYAYITESISLNDFKSSKYFVATSTEYTITRVKSVVNENSAVELIKGLASKIAHDVFKFPSQLTEEQSLKVLGLSISKINVDKSDKSSKDDEVENSKNNDDSIDRYYEKNIKKIHSKLLKSIGYQNIISSLNDAKEGKIIGLDFKEIHRELEDIKNLIEKYKK